MSERMEVQVTTRVPLAPLPAFELFTGALDSWWRHGPRFRPSMEGEGSMQLESGVGGRLLEHYADGSHFELGRVTVWEPGRQLVFSMRGRDFAPDESTTVEVHFEAEAAGARVTVLQYGFEALGPRHPVYHGMDADSFQDMMAVWWADLLAALVRSA